MNIKDLIEDNGYALYDEQLLRENDNLIYRITLAKKGGISLDDCAKIHHIIAPILAVYPPTKEDFTLEVSSCGLERVIKSLTQCALSLDELVSIKDNKGQSFKGQLKSVKENILEIKLEDAKLISLDFKDIKKIKTFIKW